VGLIHRDIKAGNLFLTRQGQVKIGDFGVSAQLASPSGSAKTFIGTPYWMAPEVILTDPENEKSHQATYTTKADIWSIGITAIEIAEKLPPLSDMHPMRALSLIPITEMNLRRPKNWSKLFQDLIKGCLNKDPTKRPSAKELLDHPFITKAQSLDRGLLIADLIQRAFIARERKNAGLEEDEDDPKSVVKETLKLLKSAPSSKPPVTVTFFSLMKY
jgi:serine/threonine protein kinase